MSELAPSTAEFSLASGMFTFSISDGYLDALLRGFYRTILRDSDYSHLGQCREISDLKQYLSGTSWGAALDIIGGRMTTQAIGRALVLRLTHQFTALRAQAAAPLAQFLEYCRMGAMIDNVALLMVGTMRQRDIKVLKAQCHPMGLFPELTLLTTCESAADLFRVLLTSPLAPYLRDCNIEYGDFSDRSIEVVRNMIYRSYLEDFYAYCLKVGGETAAVMTELLRFEADRRCITITMNSLQASDLRKDEREKLFPRFGYLEPEGIAMLCAADDQQSVHRVISHFPQYSQIISPSETGEYTIDKDFATREIELCRDAFGHQFCYGVFYAYFKLREVEIRNIVFIAECILQRQYDKARTYIPVM